MGICVTQFDPKQVERCLVASPGYLPTLEGELMTVDVPITSMPRMYIVAVYLGYINVSKDTVEEFD